MEDTYFAEIGTVEFFKKDLKLKQLGRNYYTSKDKKWRIPISRIEDGITETIIKFNLLDLENKCGTCFGTGVAPESYWSTANSKKCPSCKKGWLGVPVGAVFDHNIRKNFPELDILDRKQKGIDE